MHLETKPHVANVEVVVRLQALAVEQPDAGYSVTVPGIPGCVRHRDTLDEVRAV